MARGNYQPYNKFTLKLLEDILLAFSTSHLEMGERHFVIRTGEYGFRQFANEARSALSAWTEFDYDAVAAGVLTKNATGLTFRTPQITEWYGPNGIHVTVEIDSLYDDPVHNKIKHPLGGVAQSYRYDIFDMGTSESPNIFKCAIKGRGESRGFMAGMRNPWTGANENPYMSYSEDSASIHRMTTFGVCILDPTRTLSLVPKVIFG